MPVSYKSKSIEYWKKYPYDIGKLHFPKDEGKHDYKHEWWYINLHLTNLSTGKKYDVMVSYFPKQEDLDIPLRLFMITDEENKRYVPYKKFDFGAVRISREKQDIIFRRFLRIDRWHQLPQHAFQYHLKVNSGRYGINVLMCSKKPPLPVNGDGYVQLGSNGYSYYYSLTRLNVAGFLKIDGEKLPVVGIGWIDHQFGDFYFSEGFQGYEWFSIQLDNNVDIICWYLFEDGKVVNPVMTYMLADNSVEVPENFTIEPLDYWLSPRLKKYASKWRIKEPNKKLDIIVKTVIPNQLAYIPYPYTKKPLEIYLAGLYEGSTIIEGSFEGKHVKGVGYVELTHQRN